MINYDQGCNMTSVDITCA